MKRDRQCGVRWGETSRDTEEDRVRVTKGETGRTEGKRQGDRRERGRDRQENRG
jgi:hypothetical protein